MELVIHGNAATVENNIPGVGWSTVETSMYSNPKAVEIVRSKLAKIKLEGTINIMFDDRATPSLAIGPGGNVSAFMDLMIDGQINMFVRNNSGSEQRHNPLTPWILMHRLHHSYVLSGHRLIESKPELDTSRLIVDAENEIRNVLGIETVRHGGECELFALACTMRSARVKQLFPFCVDIAAELFAQYHITGNISFQGFEQWKFSDHGGYKKTGFDFYNNMNGNFRCFHVCKGDDVQINQQQVETINSILDKYKPLLVEAIQYETELMKTIPNII